MDTVWAFLIISSYALANVSVIEVAEPTQHECVAHAHRLEVILTELMERDPLFVGHVTDCKEIKNASTDKETPERSPAS